MSYRCIVCTSPPLYTSLIHIPIQTSVNMGETDNPTQTPTESHTHTTTTLSSSSSSDASKRKRKHKKSSKNTDDKQHDDTVKKPKIHTDRLNNIQSPSAAATATANGSAELEQNEEHSS